MRIPEFFSDVSDINTVASMSLMLLLLWSPVINPERTSTSLRVVSPKILNIH